MLLHKHSSLYTVTKNMIVWWIWLRLVIHFSQYHKYVGSLFFWDSCKDRSWMIVSFCLENAVVESTVATLVLIICQEISFVRIMLIFPCVVYFSWFRLRILSTFLIASSSNVSYANRMESLLPPPGEMRGVTSVEIGMNGVKVMGGAGDLLFGTLSLCSISGDARRQKPGPVKYRGAGCREPLLKQLTTVIVRSFELKIPNTTQREGCEW